MNLQQSLIDLNKTEKENLIIELWSHRGNKFYSESYPDVYIGGIPKYLIIIEVKENDSPTSGQIINQIRSTIEEIKTSPREVIYFLLTKGKKEPQAVIEQAKNILRCCDGIYWVRWNQVWKWLREIQKEKGKYLKRIEENILNDLIKLLEDKGMGDFTGISNGWFNNQVNESIDILKNMFIEFGYLNLSLKNPKCEEKGLSELGLEAVEEKPHVYYDPPEDKMLPELIELTYKDKDWSDELSEACIYINIGPGTGLNVGFFKPGVIYQDKEYQHLHNEADKKGFDFDPEPLTKGLANVFVSRSLIEVAMQV